MTKAGRPPIGSARRIKCSVSLTPEDHDVLTKINPSISLAVRQIIKERKEGNDNG